MRRWLGSGSPRLIAVCVTTLLVYATVTPVAAHRSGCHRWHSCPSDTSGYVCGDLGYCSQCPDNQYCQGGQLRATPAPQREPPPQTPQDIHPGTVQVLRAIDGDTIEVLIHGKREKVRYIGINTPETKHPTKEVEYYGKEAAEANRRLVEGKRVRLEFDVQTRDRYGRLLAYVYLVEGPSSSEEESIFVNAWLVEQGYAQVMTLPPNVKHQELFLRLQPEAREGGRGLWGQ